jgi:hypothetical protein
MSQFRLIQILGVIVPGMQAQAGYRGPLTVGSDTAVTVWDGPEIRSSDDYALGGHLIIGWSGDSLDEVTPAGAAQLTQGPIAATNRPRNETGAINCRAIAQQGETALDTRVAAGQIVSDVAAYLRSDPSMGIDTADTIGGVRSMAYVTDLSITQYQRNGFTVEIDFVISYGARN